VSHPFLVVVVTGLALGACSAPRTFADAYTGDLVVTLAPDDGGPERTATYRGARLIGGSTDAHLTIEAERLRGPITDDRVHSARVTIPLYASSINGTNVVNNTEQLATIVEEDRLGDLIGIAATYTLSASGGEITGADPSVRARVLLVGSFARWASPDLQGTESGAFEAFADFLAD
jgi:hypothetical protein